MSELNIRESWFNYFFVRSFDGRVEKGYTTKRVLAIRSKFMHQSADVWTEAKRIVGLDYPLEPLTLKAHSHWKFSEVHAVLWAEFKRLVETQIK